MSSPLRVLQVLPDLGLGGGQAIVDRICATADRARVEFVVAGCGAPWDLRERFRARGDAVIDLDADARPGVIGLAWRLAQLIRRAHIDIVHVHSERERGAVALAAAWTRTPVVTHVHSLWFHLEVEPGARLRRRVGGWSRAALEGRTTRAYVATSAAAAKRYRGRVDAPIIEYTPGVDVERVVTDDTVDRAQVWADFGLELGGPVLVSVARLEPGKGHDHLLDVMGHLTSRHPDAHLVVIGDGTLREEISRRVTARGFDDRVHLVGAVPNVFGALRASDVFVFASESESLGLAVIEAMAAGVPVVAFELEPFAEFLRDGETGYAVAIGDVSGFADRVHTVLSTPKNLTLVDAAYREVRDRFDPAAAADALVRCYEEIARA